ncbi:hypothetical protein [Umezawaea sp. Da 62-37]|uniref:Rv2732c family membrane protein n=1 Tax=Umezawaea sp. Da 62-37 TaxID=3075927 RepID=UPI0028F722F6|nr:hypothetical protein [Umezawaea sp. Da 62-37]WNV83613.1 hypothetical protein RM788_36340 [Umezawaea sp. Da 62-37]
MSGESDDLSRLRDEIDQVGKSAAKRVDPGAGALLIAVAVFALVVAQLLPWAGEARGWHILLGQIPDGVKVGALPRLFAFAAVIAGVLLSAFGLLLRRWALVWFCALGCFASSVIGVLSIWMQQTTANHTPGPGPGPGLVIAVLAVLVLLVKWLKLAASRPGL